MNSKFVRFCSAIILLTWTLLVGQRVGAESAGPQSLLRQAYATLAMADHDYKGHRAEAMKQIEAAAHVMKMDIHGDGRGHEKQGVSDEQLRAARSLLEQARPALHGKALKHVNHAIGQINTALKIK
jgi:hypothetical protein